jgi:putative spermidine/putrescine transport system ATP-binding protein
VRDIEYRGADVRLSLETSRGEELTAVLGEAAFFERPFEIGAAVAVDWRPEAVHELSPEG